MPKGLRERLQAGEVLLADGATGTVLMEAGLPPGTPPELWNVEFPEQILRLHQGYLEAGSEIILTNTFGGSRIKLARAGYAERAIEFNRAAAELARQAADRRALVAGDIGPTGELMAPLGQLVYEEAEDAFAEQAAALAKGGVDFFWVETMTDLEEAQAAIKGAQRAADLPVFCSLSFGPRGRTMMGVSGTRAAEALWPLGLAAIGANCGEGLDVIGPVLQQMREVHPDAPLIAKPNAGLPKLVDGETVYDMAPADFARRIPEFIKLGAQVVGACCGSTPDHIAALAAELGKGHR
jgi:5-methyltetrahydrofolate--homocysteine methyltransferase